MTDWQVPPGSATAVGSLPGTDPREAARLVLDLLPDLPVLPELPARGPHADLSGRSTALLVDLPVDLQPSGWRLVDRPSRDGRRAGDLLARDLDALEEAVGGARLDRLKVQCAGPWTLAATLELTRGERALADPGAVRDLAASLADGLRAHAADLGRRFPDVTLVVQLDEPALPAVLTGSVPTPSGVGRYRVPEAGTASEVLGTVLAAVDRPVVHCCAARPPIGLLRAAGAVGLGVDLLQPQDDDALGQAVEAGVVLLAGVAPTTGGTPPSVDAALEPVRRLWQRLALPAERLPGAVVLTSACGLASASPVFARALLGRLGEAGGALREDPL